MKQWHKHGLGFVLPLAAGATTFAFAPEYDAPDWMINVSVAGIAIATVYAVFVYYRWLDRGGNCVVVPAAMFVVGITGLLVGLAVQSPALTALGNLLPLAGIFLVGGYITKISGRRNRAN